MQERYTDRLRRVLQIARAVADEKECAYVASEHVLLAMGREGTSAAMSILHELGVDQAKLEAAYAKLLGKEDPK